jgi:hypothetical protein
MATIPDVSVTISDGAQGLTPSSSEQVHSIIGACAEGTPNTLYSYSDIPTLVANHKAGPAVEAAAHSLMVAGGPVYLVPVTQSTPGAPGSVTKTGTGPTVTAPTKSAVTEAGTAPPDVTLSGTPTKFIDLVVEITTGGARGTAIFRYSLDGGDTWAEEGVTTAATYLMPNTGVTLNFATGTDYTDDNVYTAVTCVPYDRYEAQLEIVDGGALGTATFRYCLDRDNPSGDPVWSETLTTPTSGLYTIPDTGISFTLAAGTYVAGTTYDITTTPPGFSSSDVQSAFDALAADPREWGAVHVVGQASSVSGSATIASTLDTKTEAAASGSFRYAHAMLECASDTDGNTIAAFEDFASKRVNVCAGFCRVTSVISGRSFKRSSAFPIAARLSKVGIGVDLARVIDGPLPGVTYLYRDEQLTPGLDAARFSTLRSIVGRQGYYITNARLMAPAGSDFTLVQYRRVMDVGCTVGRDTLLDSLSDGVRVNRVGGTIHEIDARGIEARVKARLNARLTQPGHASAVDCVIDRTNNVQSTQKVKSQVRITPLGYAKSIDLDIGFTSPSLSIS